MNRSQPLLAALCAIIACLPGACATRGKVGPRDGHRYVLVYLVSGPRSGQGTPDERKSMFAGHMANINRLAQSRELLIAGPFDKPADPAMRGLFVFDVPTIEAATALADTDPGVIAGEFKAQFHQMRGPAALTRALDLYNQQQAAKGGAAEAGSDQPPEDLRKYVFVRARDAARARQAATHAGLRVVWSGDLDDGAGVMALDSLDPETAREMLAKAGLHDFDTGGWWSTSALMGLPAR